MKIYLAGKWSDRVEIRSKMDELEKSGHKITHDWTSCETEDKERTQEYLGKCAAWDIEGVREADLVLVMMTDSSYVYRGTFTEIGAALALKKPTIIVCPDKQSYCTTNCFFHHPRLQHVEDWEKAMLIIRTHGYIPSTRTVGYYD